MTNNERIIAHNLLIDQAQAKVDALPTAGTSEDLTALLDEQEAIITELETVLAEKAAGGGSGDGTVETCTVTITKTDAASTHAFATILKDGIPSAVKKSSYGMTSIEFACMRGTVLYIYTAPGMGTYNSITVTGGEILQNNSTVGGIVDVVISIDPNAESMQVNLNLDPMQ